MRKGTLNYFQRKLQATGFVERIAGSDRPFCVTFGIARFCGDIIKMKLNILYRLCTVFTHVLNIIIDEIY